MLPIYMIRRQEFWLRKKHLRHIHQFRGFVLAQDTAKPLKKTFPVNWDLASIFQRVSSLNGRSCPSGGSLSVLWRGSTTPAAFLIDYEISVCSAQTVCTIAAFRTLLIRFQPIGTASYFCQRKSQCFLREAKLSAAPLHVLWFCAYW